MHSDFTFEKLQEIQTPMFEACDRMLAPFDKKLERPTGLGAGIAMPFDINRPVQHSSRVEFESEYKVIQSSLDDLRRLIKTFLASEGTPLSHEMVQRLEPILNEKFKTRPNPGNLRDSFHLIRQNICAVGGYKGSLAVLIDFAYVLDERLKELEVFKDRFWNKPHRAPDYYARAIALRLAKLFARETNKKPTTGTSGQTGDPSTPYARALREVFEILGIQATQRSYAEWAVQQIEDSDTGEPNAFAFGSAFGAPPTDEADILTNAIKNTAAEESGSN